MLYVVMLGGKHPKAKIEVHDVVFVQAEQLADAYPTLRQQWFGSPQGLHIDSWLAVDGVEDYKVSFSHQAPAAGELRLFFINLGGYQPGCFGEEHRYLLVVAPDKVSAKQRGKQLIAAGWDKPHTDNLLDVDDCLEIDAIDGRYVHLTAAPHQGIELQSDYIILS